MLANLTARLPSYLRGQLDPNYPQSEQEARDDILAIQRELDQVKANIGILDIDKLLKIVGEDQYSHGSHVFYELFQNAEDNSYEGRNPVVNLRFINGYVLIESNEIGFSKKNVKSICNAGKSLKAEDGVKTGEFIGEKGIGFKSVFKIASSVWISSNYYSFRFDRDAPLGRVYPNWDVFPIDLKIKRGFTAILLKIQDSIHPTEIVKSLESIDSNVLLFLRKLKNVNIEVNVDLQSFKSEKWKTSLSADMIPSETETLSKVAVRHGGASISYHSFRYPISGLPANPLRPRNTEIILLLPSDIESIQPRKAYAYLPIREYGFKFTVQSDFILVASRKDIDDNPWNKALIGNLPDAILSAIMQLNKSKSVLRYGWPIILPFDAFREPIFEALSQRIINLFAAYDIVEDAEGYMYPPGHLTHVPQEYRGDDGAPLLSHEHLSRKFLSEKYHAQSIGPLNTLGVQILSGLQFINDLKEFISTAPSIFQAQPHSWQDQICKVLLRLFVDKEYKTEIKALAIIPTRHGPWVSYSDSDVSLFFAEATPSPIFPSGIDNLTEVHPDVSVGSERKKLFELLGITTRPKSDLGWQIAYEHAYRVWSIHRSFNTLKKGVQQLVYLFYSGYNLAEDYAKGIRCMTEDEVMETTRNVYFRTQNPFTMGSLMTGPQSDFKFLHPDHLEAMGNDPAAPSYKEWLSKTLGIRETLRIGKPIYGGGFEPHDDLKKFAAERPMQLLSILRYHWEFYASWFHTPDPKHNAQFHDAPSTVTDSCRQTLRELISNMTVKCHGGGEAKLKEVYLPVINLLGLCDLASYRPCQKRRSCYTCRVMGSLVRDKRSNESHGGIIPADKLLDLDDGHVQNGSWNFLATFGVGIEPDLGMFLSCLSKIQGQNVAHSHVAKLYGALTGYMAQHEIEKIREFFDSGDFIYIPEKRGASTGKWHKYKLCTWNSRTPLKYIPCLLEYYHPQGNFFNYILGPNEVDLKMLKLEISFLTAADGLNHIAGILEAISGDADYGYPRYDTKEAAETILEFKDYAMFPTSLDSSILMAMEGMISYSAPKFPAVTNFTLKSALDKDQWFISDSVQLCNAFRGLVDFCLLPSSFFDRLSSLRNTLRLDTRLLSRRAKKNNIQAEGVQEHAEFTESFRKKAFYISSLIPFEDYRHRAIHRLTRMKILQCDKIKISWTIKGFGSTESIQSKIEEAECICDVRSEAIIIYFLEGQIDMRSVPFSLTQEIARLCGIYQAHDVAFLTFAMSQNDNTRLDQDLRRHLGNDKFEGLKKEFKEVAAKRDKVLDEYTIDEFGRWIPKKKPELAVPNKDEIKASQTPAEPNFTEKIYIAEEDGSKDPRNMSENNMLQEVNSNGHAIELTGKSDLNGSKLNGEALKPTSSAINNPVMQITPPSTPEKRQRTPRSDVTSRRHTSLSEVKSPRFNPKSPRPEKNTQSTNRTPKTKFSASIDITISSNSESKWIEIPVKVEVESTADSIEQKVEHKPKTRKSQNYDSSEVPDHVEESENHRHSRSNGYKRDIPLRKRESQELATEYDSKTQSGSTSTPEDDSSVTTMTAHEVEYQQKMRRAPTFPKVEEEPNEKIKVIRSKKESSGHLKCPDVPNGSPNGRRRSPSPSPENILPRRDQHSDLPRSSYSGKEFVNLSAGAIYHDEPRIFFGGEDTQDTRYFGELHVSRFLQSFLERGTYDPNKHWTSPMRTYAGHTPYNYSNHEFSACTFSVPQKLGKLRDLLIREGNIDPNLIEESCKFHIQVYPTNTDISAPFKIPEEQLEKARSMTIPNNHKINQIYILARVFNVSTNPGIYFYLDPWKLHNDKFLTLTSTSYHATIQEGAPAILAKASANQPIASETHEVYHGYDVALDEIRLLQLELNEEDEPLKGEFVCTNLNQNPTFWAISYCWGRSPDPNHCEYFETSQGKIPITDSLAWCLRALRRKGVTVMIWADAICINQKDKVEKARQVRRMGLLYSVASRVIVWMGEQRPDDSRALRILSEVQQEPENNDDEGYLYTHDLKQVEKLLERDWFTRMWIVQELVLGSNVVIICGDTEIEWDSFMDGIVECEKLLNSTKENDSIVHLRGSFRVHALDRVRKLYQQRQLSNFLELRKMFFPNRSSRPRDKIFSLLHLAWDLKSDGTGFQPDYDSEDKDVLSRFTQWLTKLSSIPDLFYWAGSSKSSSFCSWIPNFMAEKGPPQYEYPETISQWETTITNGFSSGNRLINSRHEVDLIKGSITLQPKPILTIAGALIDTIQESHPLDATRSVTHFYKVLESVRKCVSKLDSYPGDNRDNQSCQTDCNWRDDIMIRTLIGDAPGPLMASALPYFKQPLQKETWPPGFESEITQIRLDQDAHMHVSRSPESQMILSQFRATSATFIRKFPWPSVFLTEDGFIGIGAASRPGDKILILQDSKVPFLVRSLDGEENTYLLIGEAYVHGLMYSKEVRAYMKKYRIHTEVIKVI